MSLVEQAKLEMLVNGDRESADAFEAAIRAEERQQRQALVEALRALLAVTDATLCNLEDCDCEAALAQRAARAALAGETQP